MTKVVVDGDTIVYKSCFATQYSTYEIEGEDFAFRYLKDCNSWLSLNFEKDEYPDVKKVTVTEPLTHTFHIVNEIIKSIADNTQAHEMVIYLSGDNNFRKKIPYPQEYKGGRPDKPIHHGDVRKFMEGRHKAIVVHGYEADDAIGIYAALNPGCIIASVDKDLRMLPGKHYHMDSRELVEVTELDGLRSFYRQMLMGDRVDNILGLQGVGIKTAEKLIDKLHQEKDMDKIVRDKYKEQFSEDWYRMYRANYRLLKILQSEQEFKEAKEEYEIS